MDERLMKQGLEVYETAWKALDEIELNYDRHDEDLVIVIRVPGEDMKHDVIIRVIPEKTAIRFYSPFGFNMNPERFDEIGKAVCLINNRILFGKVCFDYDESLYYEFTNDYEDCMVGTGLVRDGFLCLISTVEAYDDKLLAINKGYLNADDLFKEEEN